MGVSFSQMIPIFIARFLFVSSSRSAQMEITYFISKMQQKESETDAATQKRYQTAFFVLLILNLNL